MFRTALIIILLILLASTACANTVYHEVTIHVQGEYKIKGVNNTSIYSFEGVGDALINSVYIATPEPDALKWWNLF